jgi:RNA polymerase sigma-70 factor, ECF subfamily
MRRIVRNKAIDWCRKQREVPMTNEVQVQYSEQTAEADLFETAAQSGAAQRLRDALTILSVEQREAIWLCYFEECSIMEIADIADCPPNTVKTRLFHARSMLRNSNLLSRTTVG